MSYEIRESIKKLQPYQPIEGEYEIRLDANESFITIPKRLLDKATQNVSQPNRYPDPFAKKVCESFASFYKINPKNVVAGNGSDELIALITSTFFSTDDLLLTLSNDFSMYKIYADTYSVKNEIVEKNDDLTIDVEGLIQTARQKKAKGIIFSNPCNPTSLILEKKQVIKLIEQLPDVLVIVDEAYMDFAEESIIDIADRFSNVILLKTCSKALALASIRLGFAVANEQIIRAIMAVKSPYNVNTFTQSIGEVVLLEKKFVEDCIKKVIISRDKLYCLILQLAEKFEAIEKLYKTSTNFVFIKVKNAQDIYDKLLTRSIAVRNMGEYLRISAGNEEENEKLIFALTEIMEEVK